MTSQSLYDMLSTPPFAVAVWSYCLNAKFHGHMSCHCFLVTAPSEFAGRSECGESEGKNNCLPGHPADNLRLRPDGLKNASVYTLAFHQNRHGESR